MVIRGHIENGLVVLDDNVSLPEGTEVTIVVAVAPAVSADAMSEERQRRLVDVFQRIASLPIEGSTESFNSADHDKVLYGSP